VSYEAAPATALVATHCALCGRPLVDAESVERGIGPVCADKYGAAAGPTENRATANQLIWEIAAQPAANDVPAKVSALRVLGYARVADRIAERLVPDMGTIRVAYEGNRLVIDPEGLSDDAFGALLTVLRSVPGRRWEPSRKVNTVPVSQKRALWDGLRAKLPAGVAIESEKGKVVL
jgi:hypothetical protein